MYSYQCIFAQSINLVLAYEYTWYCTYISQSRLHHRHVGLPMFSKVYISCLACYKYVINFLKLNFYLWWPTSCNHLLTPCLYLLTFIFGVTLHGKRWGWFPLKFYSNSNIGTISKYFDSSMNNRTPCCQTKRVAILFWMYNL